MFELSPFYFNRRMNRAADVYDPFRALDVLERAFFGTPAERPANTEPTHGFRTDIVDNGDSYTVQSDLPGVNKDDIGIEVSGDTLTVTARRGSKCEPKDDADKTNYVCVERSWGSYTRSFDVSGIDTDNITAAYTDGVLTLTLPKLTPAAPESRKIAIN